MAKSEVHISVDIEASGPCPPAYSMLSIGACLVGDTATSFYVELRPISEQTVSEAIEVVGKSLEYFAAHGREAKGAMAEFETWVKSVSHGRSPIFVGFNAAFDWAFINWYFHTYLGRNPFGIGPIDIKSYFMGLKGTSWEDTRSSRIPAMFKGTEKQTHNALDDARSQAQMFERMLLYAQGRQQENE
ncbi:MAG TPA: 3'-5' exonuclease [Nitrospiraceae bacterium]|jgi:DNA polymerase III epsilon subunit-like protein|nr:3'-5' exonuclease [Nitrospiraceae bacterium]